jgi:hypothetical protein
MSDKSDNMLATLESTDFVIFTSYSNNVHGFVQFLYDTLTPGFEAFIEEYAGGKIRTTIKSPAVFSTLELKKLHEYIICIPIEVYEKKNRIISLDRWRIALTPLNILQHEKLMRL